MWYTECPNCHRPIPRLRLFFTSAWGRWRCGVCGALLGLDVRRRFLAMLPWAVIVFVLFGVLRIASQGVLISVPILIAAALVTFFIFDRPVVHERTGFRCRGCGYDLQGQTKPRCPECRLEFDLAELREYLARGPQARKTPTHWGVVFIFTLVIAFLATLVAVGITTYRAAGSKGPTTSPTTTPTAPAQTPPATRRSTEARTDGTAHDASGASGGVEDPASQPAR